MNWCGMRKMCNLNSFKMRDERTVDDLSEEEYEDYQNNLDKYQEVTDNTNEMYSDTMFPNGRDDE